nr:hypothetical protein [Tanacetum cinerariifolium]
SSRTSYAVAGDLSKMELKKILIEKIEGNKFIQRSDEQRNLYKALVDAYEADKTILDSYGETVILKRRRNNDDDQEEEPSDGSDRGSSGRSTTGSKSRQVSASESAFAEEHVQTISQMDEPSYLVFKTAIQGSTQTWISELAKQADSRSFFNKLLDTPLDFSNFIMNRLRVDTLTPKLLAGPTFELMKAIQGSTQTWISELAKQADSRSFFNKLLDTPLDFSNFIMNRLRVDTLTPKLLAGPTFELM